MTTLLIPPGRRIPHLAQQVFRLLFVFGKHYLDFSRRVGALRGAQGFGVCRGCCEGVKGGQFFELRARMTPEAQSRSAANAQAM